MVFPVLLKKWMLAKRDDEHYAYVAAWEFRGENQPEELHKEDLKFDNVKLTTRSYK